MTLAQDFICGVMRNAGWALKQKKNVVFEAKSLAYRRISSETCADFSTIHSS